MNETEREFGSTFERMEGDALIVLVARLVPMRSRKAVLFCVLFQPLASDSRASV